MFLFPTPMASSSRLHSTKIFQSFKIYTHKEPLCDLGRIPSAATTSGIAGDSDGNHWECRKRPRAVSKSRLSTGLGLHLDAAGLHSQLLEPFM